MADRGMAVVGDEAAEHGALQDVGGGGAEVQALVRVVDSVFDVLAGENCTTPAPVILSITVSDTTEEAAPMMASTFCDSRRSTVWLAVSVVASPSHPGCPRSAGPGRRRRR